MQKIPRCSANSHINKFQIANFARIRENLLVLGQYGGKRVCLNMKYRKNVYLAKLTHPSGG